MASGVNDGSGVADGSGVCVFVTVGNGVGVFVFFNSEDSSVVLVPLSAITLSAEGSRTCARAWTAPHPGNQAIRMRMGNKRFMKFINPVKIVSPLRNHLSANRWLEQERISSHLLWKEKRSNCF